MENVWTVLIRGLECADKSCILPKQKNSFPNSRIWVQTVDEDGFPAYAEDTVK